MKRKPFCYSEFVRNWREKCAELRLNPDDGSPLGFAWPEERRQPDGRAWWVDSSLFEDPGPAHSSTEREAIANIAASTRAMTGTRVAALTTLDAIELVREVMTEMAAERMVQQVLPLRELHARRGVEVVTIEGVRLEVDKKSA